MSKRTWLCGTALALILAGPARPAAAEWFLDLYGGGSFTQDVDVTIRNGTTLDDRIEFDTALVGGGRFGYWLTGLGIHGWAPPWTCPTSPQMRRPPPAGQAWRFSRSRPC